MKINIEKAKSYLGVPYVWGGESLTEGGFDCSGFVYNVLNDSGIKVSRDTAQGYYKRYKDHEVSKNIIKAGDLLFFGKSKNSITHIAIAVSANDMIESVGTKSNTIKKKGKGVSINPISRRKDFVAVVRFTENVSRETLKCAKPTLRQGSKGIEVANLQKCLNHIGNYGLVIDGQFGRKTKDAVCNFQLRFGRKERLTVDGIYGKHSYKKMRELIGGI